MRTMALVQAVTALSLAIPFASAHAQWTPGSEITGHAIQVETNGIVNTVYFDAGGAARVQTPGGNIVPAQWSVVNNTLCLTTGGAQECWPYTQAFRQGQQLTLTSSCNAASRWLPLSTNPPSSSALGERG
jgi:hypothetical protein